jgi:hypothetical protein
MAGVGKLKPSAVAMAWSSSIEEDLRRSSVEEFSVEGCVGDVGRTVEQVE